MTIEFGQKVYIEYPPNTMGAGAAKDLAHFVDVSLKIVDIEYLDGIPLADIMQPVGIQFNVDDTITDSNMRISFSAQNAKLEFTIHSSYLASMQEFTQIPPSIRQHVVAGAIVAGMYQDRGTSGKFLDFEEIHRLYKEYIDREGIILKAAAQGKKENIEILRGEDIYFD